MKTWNDYKEYVRTVDPEIGKDIDEVENISSIVSAMVEQRTSLGLSQRELAAMCGIPQSSVARIESCKTTPNLGIGLAQEGRKDDLRKEYSTADVTNRHYQGGFPKTVRRECVGGRSIR